MYAHTNNSSYAQSCGLMSQHQHVNYPTNNNVSSVCLMSNGHEFDIANHEAIMLSSYGNNASSSNGSGCTSSSCIGSGSPGSPLSCCSSNHPPNCSSPLLQRSLSSHSLNLLTNGIFPHVSSSPTSGLSDLDIASQGVKILDHQHHHYHHHNHHHRRGGSPLANESTSSIIEGMTKACRYSPEEKKERIERYRNKRNQRNFTKKIQYACRKTLADSRPRVRGRFARNDEIETIYYSSDVQQNDIAGEDDDDLQDEQQWIHLLDYISSNLVP